MNLAFPAAAIVLLAPSLAAADQQAACDYVQEYLSGTADILLDARDGKPTANAVENLADAAERAAAEMRAAAWTPTSIAATDAVFAFTTGLGGDLTESNATDLLTWADAVARDAGEICGWDIVPVFVRPGEGDNRACPQVVKALHAFEKARPVIAAEEGAPPPMMAMPAAVEARKAQGHAEASQWSAATLDAFGAIDQRARAIATGAGEPGAETANTLTALAAGIADEGRVICGDYDFRNIASGSVQ